MADYSAKYKDYKKLETTVDHIQQDTEQLTADYQSEMRKIEPDIAEELQEKRDAARAEMETAAKSKLQAKYGYGFEEGKFADARHSTDEKLAIKRSRVNVKDTIKENQMLIKQKGEQTPDLAPKKSHHHHR